MATSQMPHKTIPSDFETEAELLRVLSSVRRKNVPIFVISTLCVAILALALAVSLFLYLQISQMGKELKQEIEDFQETTDRSWQLLLFDNQQQYINGLMGVGRTKRGAYYSPPSLNCRCAPSAQNCPPGAPGLAGDKGEDGVPGPPGKPGPPGEGAGAYEFEQIKPPCVLCPPGPAGIKGRPGVAGRNGPVGSAGENARPAKEGKPGPKGEPGEYGPAGRAGPTGPPGLPGTDATSWARVGTPGAKGSPGPQGPAGDAGPPGVNGEPGGDGMPGGVGPFGLRGENGTPGIPGNRGSPGKPSADGKYCPCPPRSADKANARASLLQDVAPSASIDRNPSNFEFRARSDNLDKSRGNHLTQKKVVKKTKANDQLQGRKVGENGKNFGKNQNRRAENSRKETKTEHSEKRKGS